MFKVLKSIAICGIVACTLGCKQQSNGTYIIYKIQPEEGSETQPLGYSDSLYNVMRSTLNGSRYEIVFGDKFATVKSLSRQTQAILPKVESEKDADVYKQEEVRDKTTIKTILKRSKEGELISIVEIARPLLIGESPETFGLLKFYEKRAQAVCYMNKID